MTRIALIGLEDGDERLGKILAQLTELHPDYEVVVIKDPEQLRAQQTEYSVVVIDEAAQRDPRWDQVINVGTIGHVDHGIQPARTLRALDRSTKARDWYDRPRRGKGERKAGRADRWNGNGRNY